MDEEPGEGGGGPHNLTTQKAGSGEVVIQGEGHGGRVNLTTENGASGEVVTRGRGGMGVDTR